MENGYNLTKDQLTKAWRWFAGAALIVLVLLVFNLHSLSVTEVPADSRAWESVVAARLILFRLVVGLSAASIVIALAVAAFHRVDCSSLGRRLFHWADTDSDQVKAANQVNAGLFFAALALGFLLILAGILR